MAGTRKSASASAACVCRCWSRSACAPMASAWCSTSAWLAMKAPPAGRDVIQSVVERQVGRPLLAIIDGSAGLAAALREQWPTLAIQRCTAHTLWNLEAKAPVRLREELAEDYRRMIYAETRSLVD